MVRCRPAAVHPLSPAGPVGGRRRPLVGDRLLLPAGGGLGPHRTGQGAGAPGPRLPDGSRPHPAGPGPVPSAPAAGLAPGPSGTGGPGAPPPPPPPPVGPAPRGLVPAGPLIG